MKQGTDLEGYPREVWNEDAPDHKYAVSGLCRRCQKIDRGNWDSPWVYNISSTMMHFAGEAEYTLCGVKADDSQWLWQL